MDYDKAEDDYLMIRAEQMCTGANAHGVHTTTYALDSQWSSKKGDSEIAARCRKALRIYVSGKPFKLPKGKMF